MIVSHKYKYVFIALPRAASNAVAKEVMENYDGVQALNHHALYQDLLHAAGENKQLFHRN